MCAEDSLYGLEDDFQSVTSVQAVEKARSQKMPSLHMEQM